MNRVTGKFHGKYRGVVVSNIDLSGSQTGRLLVRVEDVMGSDPCLWASPSPVVAGTQMGIYAIPPINAGVWIEFEKGDPNYPVWTGGIPGSSTEIPAAATAAPPTSPPIVIQSLSQNRIILSSLPGEGITLETADGQLGPCIVISATSIKLSCGPALSVEIGPDAIKINGESIVVTSV